MATAVEAASPAQAAVLRRRLGDPALDVDGVEQLREIIIDTGALQHVEALIDALTAQAFRALESPHIQEPAREVLHGLAIAATARSV